MSSSSDSANQSKNLSLYEYPPLDENAIRLVTLYPGHLEDEIHLTLHHEVLDTNNRPIFEALSYAWGSTDLAITIKIGPDAKHTLLVTHNLVVALQHLRHDNKLRILWVDAVCINQKDMEERSSQVKRMSDIYSVADRVVVWLGPEENDSAMAMKLLADLDANIHVDWEYRTMHASTNQLHWADTSKELPYKQQEKLALDAFINRPWFERLWVLQEVVLANSQAVVMCGSMMILWQSFCNSIFCLRNKPFQHRTFFSRIDMIYQMAVLKPNDSLRTLLDFTRGRKCSDPRDRIYALLSLQGHEDFHVEPDYTKSTADVYQEFCLQFLKFYGRLELLGACELPTAMPNTPTWVPNWAVERTLSFSSQPDACGKSRARVQHLDHRILRITGISLGTVRDSQELEMGMTYLGAINCIRAHAPADVLQRNYIGGCSLLEAYCKLICGDVFAETCAPPVGNHPSLQQRKDVLQKLLTAGLVSTPSYSVLPGSDVADLVHMCHKVCSGRSLITMEDGFIGLALAAVRPRDEIVVLLGCPSPIVLRRNTAAQYQVVGECYLQGLMR